MTYFIAELSIYFDLSCGKFRRCHSRTDKCRSGVENYVNDIARSHSIIDKCRSGVENYLNDIARWHSSIDKCRSGMENFSFHVYNEFLATASAAAKN